MKIEKTNGLYRKPGIRAETRVPLLVWLPILLVLTSVLLVVSLRTIVIQNESLPTIELARKNTWKVAVVGDIACSPSDPNYNDGAGITRACGHKEVGDAIEREPLDALFLLGDIQYDYGIFEDFEKSFIPHFRTIQVPTYSVPGNHDYGQGNLDGYRKAYSQYMPNVTYEKEGRTYFDFRIGPWKVYALDSNCTYVGGCGKESEQYKWLTRQVNFNDPVCSLAMWHHPRFTSGIHNRPEETSLTLDFWESLDFAGTDVVLSGHDHHFERFEPKNVSGDPDISGISQFVVGTGGHSLRPPKEPLQQGSQKIIDDQFGYMLLELSHGSYSWEFKNTYGDVLDAGKGVCK